MLLIARGRAVRLSPWTPPLNNKAGESKSLTPRHSNNGLPFEFSDPIVDLNRNRPPFRVVDHRSYAHGLGILLAQVGRHILHGASGSDDPGQQEDIAAFDRNGDVLDDFGCRLASVVLTAFHLDDVELDASTLRHLLDEASQATRLTAVDDDGYDIKLELATARSVSRRVPPCGV